MREIALFNHDNKFNETLRRFTAPFLLVGATLPSLGFADAKQVERASHSALSECKEKTDKEKLEKLHSNLDGLSKGLKILKYATLAASVKSPTAELEAVSKVSDKLSSTSDKLEKGIGQILELLEDEKDEEAKDLAKDLGSESKRLTSNGDQLRALKNKIRAIEVGLISESSDKEKFEVTIELLTNNPEEALSRFVAQGDAMEQNIEVMKERKDALEEVVDTSGTVAKALIGLEDALTTLAKYAPPFTDMLILSAVEAYNLSRDCGEVQSAAEAKLLEVKNTLEAEEARLDNLDTNLQTFWGTTR